MQTPASKERFIPNPVVTPRCTATRDATTGKIDVGFWYGPAEEGKVHFHTLTSRSAHELFEELVGALAQEGRGA